MGNISKVKLKIVFLTKNLNLNNGWGGYSFYLIKALKRQGLEVVVIDSSKKYSQAKKMIKDCDVVHSLIEPMVFLGSLVSGHRPFFVTAHGTYAVEPLDKFCLSGLKLRYAYKKATAVICVSHFTESEIKKRILDAKTVVINNGVNFEKFQKEKIAKPNLLENHSPIILGVGALKSRKGYHLTIPAVACLKKQYPNFLYIISGDQSDARYFDKLKFLVQEHGLQNNVKFIIASDDELVYLYRHSDIFLLTPLNIDHHFEGFGLVYLEAAAAGLPSIGSSDCGAEDAIKNNQTGFLVPQDNVEATSNAIMELLGNRELLVKMGENAKSFAAEMTWDKVAKEIILLYSKSLSDRLN